MRIGLHGRSGVSVALLLLASAAVPAAVSSPERFAVHDTPRPVAELPFENGQGEAMTLADFHGRIVLLNLWATWCPPCRNEMPTLDRLQAELGGEHFEVVALSVDRAGPGVVREFFAEEGIEHLALYIDASMRALPRLAVTGLPTTLVLDARGREIARLVGEADWAAPAMLAYFRGLIAARTEAETP